MDIRRDQIEWEVLEKGNMVVISLMRRAFPMTVPAGSSDTVELSSGVKRAATVGNQCTVRGFATEIKIVGGELGYKRTLNVSSTTKIQQFCQFLLLNNDVLEQQRSKTQSSLRPSPFRQQFSDPSRLFHHDSTRHFTHPSSRSRDTRRSVQFRQDRYSHQTSRLLVQL